MARIVVEGTAPARRTFNRLCTRGLGPSQLLVTQGYVGPPAFVIVAFQRNFGQSGLKRRQRDLDLVVVWAKLIEVNDKSPAKNVQGFVKVPIERTHKPTSIIMELISLRVISIAQWGLKVIARLIK